MRTHDALRAEVATGEALREVADVGHLLPRQAAAAQLRVAQRQDRRRLELQRPLHACMRTDVIVQTLQDEIYLLSTVLINSQAQPPSPCRPLR